MRARPGKVSAHAISKEPVSLRSSQRIGRQEYSLAPPALKPGAEGTL